jgi:hypothetical protein
MRIFLSFVSPHAGYHIEIKINYALRMCVCNNFVRNDFIEMNERVVLEHRICKLKQYIFITSICSCLHKV